MKARYRFFAFFFSVLCLLVSNSEFCVFSAGGQCTITFNHGASSYVAIIPDDVEFTSENSYICDRVYGVSAFNSGGNKLVHCEMSASNTNYDSNKDAGDFHLKAAGSDISAPYRIYYREGENMIKVLMNSNSKADLGSTDLAFVSVPIRFVLYPTDTTEMGEVRESDKKFVVSGVSSAVEPGVLEGFPVGLYTEVLTFTFSVIDKPQA